MTDAYLKLRPTGEPIPYDKKGDFTANHKKHWPKITNIRVNPKGEATRKMIVEQCGGPTYKHIAKAKDLYFRNFDSPSQDEIADFDSLPWFVWSPPENLRRDHDAAIEEIANFEAGVKNDMEHWFSEEVYPKIGKFVSRYNSGTRRCQDLVISDTLLTRYKNLGLPLVQKKERNVSVARRETHRLKQEEKANAPKEEEITRYYEQFLEAYRATPDFTMIVRRWSDYRRSVGLPNDTPQYPWHRWAEGIPLWMFKEVLRTPCTDPWKNWKKWSPNQLPNESQAAMLKSVIFPETKAQFATFFSHYVQGLESHDIPNIEGVSHAGSGVGGWFQASEAYREEFPETYSLAQPTGIRKSPIIMLGKMATESFFSSVIVVQLTKLYGWTEDEGTSLKDKAWDTLNDKLGSYDKHMNVTRRRQNNWLIRCSKAFFEESFKYYGIPQKDWPSSLQQGTLNRSVAKLFHSHFRSRYDTEYRERRVLRSSIKRLFAKFASEQLVDALDDHTIETWRKERSTAWAGLSDKSVFTKWLTVQQFWRDRVKGRQNVDHLTPVDAVKLLRTMIEKGKFRTEKEVMDSVAHFSNLLPDEEDRNMLKSNMINLIKLWKDGEWRYLCYDPDNAEKYCLLTYFEIQEIAEERDLDFYDIVVSVWGQDPQYDPLMFAFSRRELRQNLAELLDVWEQQEPAFSLDSYLIGKDRDELIRNEKERLEE